MPDPPSGERRRSFKELNAELRPLKARMKELIAAERGLRERLQIGQRVRALKAEAETLVTDERLRAELAQEGARLDAQCARMEPEIRRLESYCEQAGKLVASIGALPHGAGPDAMRVALINGLRRVTQEHGLAAPDQQRVPDDAFLRAVEETVKEIEFRLASPEEDG
jgi:hypothetical protein